MPRCNSPFPWIGALSPGKVLRQLLTGWIRLWLIPLSMTGLTIEMLLPVSTVNSQGLPLIVPGTVRLSSLLSIDPVLIMSTSLTMGAVDVPA